MRLGGLALLLFLSSPARALPTCFYIDLGPEGPRKTATPCPQELRYAENDMPPTPYGMIWIKKKERRDYWAAILFVRKFDDVAPAIPPPGDHDYPFAVIRTDDGETHQINPDAEDYLRRAVAEGTLGRPFWALAYAEQGAALAPDDPRLRNLSKALAAKLGGGPISPAAQFFLAQDAFANGHRALERGDPSGASLWFDRSLAVRPTAQAYFFRSQLRHQLGRDADALKDADDGLAMTPNDLSLRGARDLAAQALAAARPPAPAPAAGPVAAPPAAASPAAPPIPAAAPARPEDDRPVLFLILAVLTLGSSGGYWLANRRGRRATAETTAATIVDRRTLLDGRTDATPVLRRYELKSKIGEGGMGVVYEASERNLGKRVAIKQMRAEIKNSERERAAFLREAEIISRLSHPSIVAFQEVIEENGEIFLVFDYVDGKPLSQLLAERRRLTLAECQGVFSQVCAAMSYAHRAHVLHRDLKPSNIMVEPGGGVKVMDFGIARQAKETITRLTRADASGTPAYMAPEQHLGSFARASDIYALGVCLYEAMTGRLPFPGPDFLAQKERMLYPPARVIATDLPKETELLFQATLAVDPTKRVADAEELIGSLKSLG